MSPRPHDGMVWPLMSVRLACSGTRAYSVNGPENMVIESVRPDILLIDANAIGYAAMYQPSLRQLSHGGMCTSALHGVPASVLRIMRSRPGAVPLILWDGHSRFRYGLYPEYKAGRASDADKEQIRAQYKSQTPHLRHLFMSAGIPQVSHPDVEADDIAGLIARNAPDDLNILFVSSDSDWMQALKPNVSQYNPVLGKFIDLAGLMAGEHKDGVFDSTEQYLAAKCMAGDKSDNIVGVVGIGLATAAKFLRQYGSFEALWERADAGERFRGVKLQSILTPEAREIYRINRTIIDWRQCPMPEIFTSAVAPDFDELEHITSRFGLRSIGSQLQSMAKRVVADRTHQQWQRTISRVEQIMFERAVDQDLDQEDGDEDDDVIEQDRRMRPAA